jgi:hypothetical protein
MPHPRFPEAPRITLLISLAALAACTSQKTSPPLSGEQILRESQGMAQLGQRYMDGENMVRKGEDLVRQGQAKVSEGERMIDEGKRIMQESEQSYGELKR